MKKLLGITVFLVIVYAGLLLSHPNAPSWGTHFLLSQRIGLYGILALAAGILIVSGGIDLSMGSLVCLCATVFGLLVVDYQVPIPLAFLAMLGVGALAGIINGLLVTKLNLQPFMVTLCGLFIFRSLARWLTNDSKIEGLSNTFDETLLPGSDKNLLQFFEGDFLGISIYFWILLALVAVGTLFLHFSVYGRYFIAIGSNEKAARYSGISTDIYRILAFMLCSLLTAGYTFLALMKTPSVTPSTMGQNDELIAIACAVLGGCTLRGGEGTIYGMIVGTMILQILRMMNTFRGISSAAEGTMIGCILLAGIILDEWLRRRQGQAR